MVNFTPIFYDFTPKIYLYFIILRTVKTKNFRDNKNSDPPVWYKKKNEETENER